MIRRLAELFRYLLTAFGRQPGGFRAPDTPTTHHEPIPRPTSEAEKRRRRGGVARKKRKRRKVRNRIAKASRRGK